MSAHRIAAGFVFFVGSILSFGGAWSLFYGANGHPPNSLIEGVLISLMGMAFIGFMMPSMTPWHDVVWDEISLEGPNRLFGPTLRLSRIKISWDDIVETGQTFTKYYYVRTASGDVIYYSPYSSGLKQFDERLSRCLSREW